MFIHCVKKVPFANIDTDNSVQFLNIYASTPVNTGQLKPILIPHCHHKKFYHH